MRRYEYILVFPAGAANRAPTDGSARHPVPEDADALAQLMLDAYVGTIDYEGETLEDARTELAGYLEGSPVLDCSWLHTVDGVPVSASLVSVWDERECPIVSYVMTAPAWKAKGLASALLARSLASLAEAGHREVRAVITEGNVPSETIFARAGFRRR